MPYRRAARPDAKPAPAELLFAAVDRERRNRSGLAVFQFFALPSTAAWLVGSFFGPGAGLGAMVLAAIAVVAWWRHRSTAHDRILVVTEGELSVQTVRSHEVKARLRLDDLADVILDTKVIQRVQDGGQMIAVMRAIDTRVAPDADVSRIVIVASDGTETPIAEKYIANMDATEWVCKIRVFLRRHGWVPEDERLSELSSDSADNPRFPGVGRQ